MSDRAAKWQADFQKSKATLSQLQAELQRWEQLGTQTTGQGGERAKQGAMLRARVSTFRLDIERLGRELEGLASNSAEHKVTQKSITQFRDDLAQLNRDLQELQQRSKGTAAPSPSSSLASTPGSSFVRLAGDNNARTGGAEMQPMSNRQALQQQQQFMRDLQEPLSALEGSVANLHQVSTMIRGEIVSQNQLLDETNQATDRVSTRMGRTRELLLRVSRQDSRNKYLVCGILALLGVLIVIFIYQVAP